MNETNPINKCTAVFPLPPCGFAGKCVNNSYCVCDKGFSTNSFSIWGEEVCDAHEGVLKAIFFFAAFVSLFCLIMTFNSVKRFYKFTQQNSNKVSLSWEGVVIPKFLTLAAVVFQLWANSIFILYPDTVYLVHPLSTFLIPLSAFCQGWSSELSVSYFASKLRKMVKNNKQRRVGNKKNLLDSLKKLISFRSLLLFLAFETPIIGLLLDNTAVTRWGNLCICIATVMQGRRVVRVLNELTKEFEDAKVNLSEMGGDTTQGAMEHRINRALASVQKHKKVAKSVYTSGAIVSVIIFLWPLLLRETKYIIPLMGAGQILEGTRENARKIKHAMDQDGPKGSKVYSKFSTTSKIETTITPLD